MPDRRNKREPDSVVELDREELGFVLEPAQVELGAGYTVKVRYDDEDKPIVCVKTFGNIDIPKMMKEIKRAFPEAQIRQQGHAKTVSIAKRSIRKGKSK